MSTIMATASHSPQLQLFFWSVCIPCSHFANIINYLIINNQYIKCFLYSLCDKISGIKKICSLNHEEMLYYCRPISFFLHFPFSDFIFEVRNMSLVVKKCYYGVPVQRSG